MTAKTAIDCTRGLSREQRAIARRNKREALLAPTGTAGGITPAEREKRVKIMLARMDKIDAIKKASEAEDERRFGLHDLPDRVATDNPFVEKPLGPEGVAEAHSLMPDFGPRLPYVVSLALFDGDEMLYACSGIALPPGITREHLTRYVTSARLVTAFNDNRNKDDKLRIQVGLPDGKTTDGFLGLYDQDIAIVTSLGFNGVSPVILPKDISVPSHHDKLIVAGRGYKSGSLMITSGLSVVDHFGEHLQLFQGDGSLEAALGGPVADTRGYFLGISISYTQGRLLFLPQKFLCQRLKHFRILPSKNQNFRRYTLPSNVHSIVPSGFMKTINYLRCMGYPMPPPLVLEFSGELRNTFEDDFGEFYAWEGYPFNFSARSSGEYVWGRLPKFVVSNISRRVVSLASFLGKCRIFTCTGLLIEWYGNSETHTVVLTSASLVRTRDAKDMIDNRLMIEVFLPPEQRVKGTLELYDLNYNIAIISVEEEFRDSCPEDIFETVQMPSRIVVAVGRHPAEGLLMASIGQMKQRNPRDKRIKLGCEDLKLSTCRIKKAGIGGPLIDFDSGSFVGMNFYDGSPDTPFLPRSTVVQVLSAASELPSKCGLHQSQPIVDKPTLKRWPVPEAFWFHGGLDASMYHLPPPGRRVLQ